MRVVPRRVITVVAVVGVAVATIACGSRVERVTGGSGIAVADGEGGLVRAAPSGPVLTTEAGAVEALAMLGVGPVELIDAPAIAERLRKAPAPRLAVLGPGVERPDGVPVLRWATREPAATGSLIARLGLALGRGAEGVRVGRATDAAIADVLRRAAAEPPVRVLVEGPAVGELAVLVQVLGGRPVVYAGIAATIRDDPEVWLVTPGATTTLARLRATVEFRRVTAVNRRRFAVIDPTLYGPSPRLADRLTDLDDILHPTS